MNNKIIVLFFTVFLFGFSGVTEYKDGADTIARTYTSTSDVIYQVEVYGFPSLKPDEGDGGVLGTVQWAVDQVAPGGEIHLMGGEDFGFSTPLRINKSGVRVRCLFGKGKNIIMPLADMSYIWQVGNVTDKVEFVKIEDCSFYGRGETGLVASGVLFHNVTGSKFINNDMQLFKGRTFQMSGDGSVFSNINWIVGNALYNCGAACIAFTGTGGNTDHWITNNFFSTSSLESNEPVGWFGAFGGHKFYNNHWHGSKSKGCVKFYGGGNITIQGDFWDTCGDGPSVDANLRWSSISGRIYNNGAVSSVNGHDGILVKGYKNNIGPMTIVQDSKTIQIKDGVVVSGDMNNIDNIICDSISGTCVREIPGTIRTKIGLVN